MTAFDPVAAFHAKVDRNGPFVPGRAYLGRCHLWTGASVQSKAGHLKWRGRYVNAPRVALEIAGRPLPSHLFACHKCDNPPCVRPFHLFSGTAADNSADMVAKGRAATGDRNGTRQRPESIPRGESRPGAKLTPESVRLIRALAASRIRQRDLAVRFGVGQATVSRIVRRVKWAHLA